MNFSKSKLILIVLAIAASVGCLGFMGVRAYVAKIYDSRSCEWANIDNIEMHTSVDIPPVEDCECMYDPVYDAKKIVFTFEKSVNAQEYIARNKLQLLNGELPKSIAGFAARQFRPAQTLYVRERLRHNEERYELVFDPARKKLWIYLEYLN